MRWIRMLRSLLIALFRSKLNINETSTVTFTVWLNEIDASIMNNAAMMTVFETGRIDFMVRTGFFKLARKQNWYVPGTSISVQFFRPLKAFHKAILTTRILHMNEHAIFIEQKIKRKEKDIALCIVKSKVKSGREDIDTREILSHLNAKNIQIESGELIELFEKQDEAFKNEMYQK